MSLKASLFFDEIRVRVTLTSPTLLVILTEKAAAVPHEVESLRLSVRTETAKRPIKHPLFSYEKKKNRGLMNSYKVNSEILGLWRFES